MMNVPKLIRACLGDSNTLAVSSANRLSRTQSLPVRLQGSRGAVGALIDLSVTS